MITLKLQKIGNSVGAVFPKEVLARMQVAEGDTLFLTEAPEGYRITPDDPELEEQMTVARKGMRKRRRQSCALHVTAIEVERLWLSLTIDHSAGS